MAAIQGTRIRGELELFMCHYNAYTYLTSVTARHYQWLVGTNLQWPTKDHPQSSRFLKFSLSPRRSALQCYKRQSRSMHSRNSRNKENATLNCRSVPTSMLQYHDSGSQQQFDMIFSMHWMYPIHLIHMIHRMQTPIQLMPKIYQSYQ